MSQMDNFNQPQELPDPLIECLGCEFEFRQSELNDGFCEDCQEEELINRDFLESEEALDEAIHLAFEARH